MNSQRLTRRSFVVGSAASAVAAGVALDAATRVSAAASDGDLVVGRFVSAEGARSGVVAIAGGRSIPVMLDSAAFVAHGTDGLVDSLTVFVPGEEVVLRGKPSGGGIAVVELQSVYTSVSGIVTADSGEYVLVTPSDQHVRVPREVVQRDVPSGIRAGMTYSATIWTDPRNGDVTALDLSGEG